MVTLFDNLTKYSFLRLLEQFFCGWIFLATVVLLVVWALPHTIAARNIALFTGLIAAFGWVWITKPSLNWKALWPIICLLLVPLWVMLHWYFLSELKDQQWQELKSTWLRVLAALLLGSTTGLILNRRPKMVWWVILAMILLPTITFIQYLYQVHLQHHWILPSGMFYGFYKGKFSAVYFVLCQVLIGFGFIYFALNGLQKARLLPLLFGTILVFSGIVDFIAARALNGIIVSTLALLLCILVLLYSSLNVEGQKRSLKKHLQLGAVALLALTILGSGLFLFWTYDRQQEGKLANLIGDIRISSQIDQNQAWVKDGGASTLPVDDKGRHINGSTYERVSWFIKGTRLVRENPLGNGVSHMAFGYYMRAQYPQSSVQMTHSAWVDFTLGLGLPGLILTWCSILGVVWLSIRAQNQDRGSGFTEQVVAVGSPIPCIALWLIAGLFGFWIVGEVSEREYIEHYFFLIALFAAAVSSNKRLEVRESKGS
ncbi:O-antigen ligase family protein [Polynucleobacter sp. UK-Mo-2m-Kol15]|uniref:O-antigen ligase family protein n=1 Tax=Polynucleobacter sp. UK-Mo-2m-Kol15 TaxID=2576916 RepID=UPI001C0DA1B2|nr:O-antigen ligase family protein [Polynucleobacter sp. UK-Mo-2m-Kol15]